MRDVVTFILACIPIAAGLALVLVAFKERSRAVTAVVKPGDPTSSALRRGTPSNRK